MATPVLHLVVGPNGAGKTTYYDQILRPATWLPFINADLIAEQRWPGDTAAHAYEAAAEAAARRTAAIEARRQALSLADEARVLDNSRARSAFRLVASFLAGELVATPEWPSWTPPDLK